MINIETNSISIRSSLGNAGDLSGRYVWGRNDEIALKDLLSGTALFGRGIELEGRSVLIRTSNQLTTASALIELDGLASRIILCPPDLDPAHLPYLIETAEVDGVVSDGALTQVPGSRQLYFSPCSRSIVPGNGHAPAVRETEWVLLTSGTTGRPKLVAQTLSNLTGAVPKGVHSGKPVVWSTFYDIRRYGGLQIFLRAVMGGHSLVLSSHEESAAQFLERAGARGVTHISGTPSQWRTGLMSGAAHLIHPDYVRLSGEVVDQGILNQLKATYPDARVGHAFASTEAGVAFEVNDGHAGFPAEALEQTPNVEMKVENGSLHIRSARTAAKYLGEHAPILKRDDGFVDTGDLVEIRDGRYFFVGRRDGVINVGGLKVHPEEVEMVINRHPQVQGSLVRAKKNPVTGFVVVADVVAKSEGELSPEDVQALRTSLLQFCRKSLASHKIPASFNFVPELSVGGSGKMSRPRTHA